MFCIQIEIAIGIGIEIEKNMNLGREKLDVYRLSIGYVAWVYEKADSLNGVHRPARAQWLRASQSIPLNIAEGNGKTAEADRRRYFEIARSSALECAAIQDVLVVGKALDKMESRNRKDELDRMAAMLSRLGGRGYQVREDQEVYSIDFDPDSDFDPDFDPEENESQP
ncbi:MAG: four helix bundle protein [Desulfobacterales bacterium]|nr:four helix bundle protein [Desulfobacterales bacterium]